MNPRKKKTNEQTTPVPRKISRPRIWLFRVVALLFPLGLLAALELCLRLADYGFDPHFFRSLQIDGQNYLVQNDAFSYRFFPKETARNPGAFRMLAQKPAGTIRIFVLGESAAMGDPEPAFGPARFMEAMLRDRFPDTRFEVINVAFTAINSHVILPIARECARHDGDFWVVYMGNNEMVGPFGAATVFGKQAPPLPYVRLITAIKATRSGQLVSELAKRLHGEKAPANSWGGMQMFLKNQIAPDSPLKNTVYLNFQKNLEDILKAGGQSGSKILLNSVAVNLKDCPPFASLESNGKSAESEYRQGRTYLGANQADLAREHLQLACDLDAMPFRTDSHENQIIRDATGRFPANQITFIDSAKLLGEQLPDRMCGNETFFEHVHFDFSGSYRLGRLWAEQITSMLPDKNQRSGSWLTESQCDQQLGLSDWNRAVVLQHMATRLQSPPFTSQTNNAERIHQLLSRVKTLEGQQNPETAAITRSNFISQLAIHGDDFTLWGNYAIFLQMIGDTPECIKAWGKVRDLIPHDYLAYFQIGRQESNLGQLDAAEDNLRHALKIHPSLTEGWSELGGVLALKKDYPGALQCYAQAQRQRPEDAQIAFRTGKIYALMGDHAKAMDEYRRAIQFNPGLWEAHYELGGELDASQQTEAALHEFREAARLKPDYSRTRFNFGILLAKSGRLDEAQNEFEAALKLEPGYQNAQEALAKIQFLKQHIKKQP